MRKRMLMIMMAVVVGISAFPMDISAEPVVTKMSRDDDDEDTYDNDENDDDDDEDAYELTKGDIIVKPSKKTIEIGETFFIDLYPSNEIDDEYADVSNEEWEELLSENIDNITFRSKKSSVASVSKQGKVKGKKKGNTIIKTTVTFRDGSEGNYKTKVYVTR